MRHFALRIAGWSVVFILTLEVCARLDDAINYRAPLIGAYDNETLYTYDALGKTGKPGARYLKWQLNSHGFRGPELKNGRTRVMCLGSSETFGLYEAPDKEWPRQLEYALNARGGGSAYEVINAAYPGMSLATTNVRLPIWLADFAPKVVVVYPSLANYIWLPYLSSKVATPPAEPWFAPRLRGRVENLLKSSLPAGIQNSIRTWQTEREAQRFKTVMPRVPEANVERFRQDLNHLVETASRSRVEVILVTHATFFGGSVTDGSRPLLAQWRRFYPMLAEDGFLDLEKRLNDVIRQEAARRNLVVVDAARQMPAGRKMFVEFVHFTDAGAEHLAQLVAPHILSMTPPSNTAYNLRQRH